MSSIAPPHLRREEINQKWVKKARNNEKVTPLSEITRNAPSTSRLRSRKPFHKSEIENFNLKDKWTEEWNWYIPKGGEFIEDPTVKLPGFDTGSRKEWVTCNRLRSRHARTEATLHKWGAKTSPLCPKCKQAQQDTDHLVAECPITKLHGGYQEVHNFGDDFIEWLSREQVMV